MSLPMLLAGRHVYASRPAPVYAPWDGRLLHEVSEASVDEMDAAAAAAAASVADTRALAPWRRAEILRRIATSLRAETEVIAGLIRDEAGKPITLARAEVSRAAETLELCAEEARRANGEMVPVDAVASGAGRIAFTRRVGRGPVLAITPFNFPLNLVCHKLGPALAAGCPIVVKPAEQTPAAALRLGELVLEAGWPERALSVLPVPRRAAPQLVADRRFKVVSFTGSDRVGWAIRAAAPHAQVVLELGGNAAVILEPDANLDMAVPRIIAGAYAYAGQVCISVQHVLVASSRAEELRERLSVAAAKVPTGDPAREDVLCGPMIDKANVERLRSWIAEARAGGASMLVENEGSETVVGATLLAGVPADARVRTEEVFGPVAHIDSYDDLDTTFHQLNRGRFGLQVGMYTRDVRSLLRAQERLEVGAIIHDDVPTFRADPMPYGGVKDSGFGREGPRYAVEEMTEPRLLVLRND